MHFLTTLIFIMGCASNSTKEMTAQPIPFSTNTISVNSLDFKNQRYPSWFVYPPSEVIGVGIVRYSYVEEDESYKLAFEMALDDLNSNAMSVVTIEQILKDRRIATQTEFAITDKFNLDNIVKLDSVRYDDWVFYLISGKELTVDNSPIQLPVININDLPPSRISITDISSNSYGIYEGLQYSPFKAWTLSKQDALKNLATYKVTQIKSLDKIFDDNLSNIKYSKSRIITKEVKVINRGITKENEFVTFLSVNNDNLNSLIK